MRGLMHVARLWVGVLRIWTLEALAVRAALASRRLSGLAARAATRAEEQRARARDMVLPW